MKFSEIADLLEGIPYTQKERGKQLYDFILNNKPRRILELGFAHGVASCYMAAALDELGSGSIDCVDIESSKDFDPSLEDLLGKTGLTKYVTIVREVNSYTWFLKKEIEKQTENYVCKTKYDLCFIDGPKNWTIDGLAFFAVDKLLNQGGTIVFDDYNWKYSEYSKQISDGIAIRDLSEDQVNTANIKLVFQLLVMQHPSYSDFIIDEDWAWARKEQSEIKNVRVIATQSMKYKLLKKVRSLLRK